MTEFDKERANLIFRYYNWDSTQHDKYLENEETKKQKFFLLCKNCNKKITASIKITSNWISHLRVAHITQYNEYLTEKSRIRIDSPSTPRNSPTPISRADQHIQRTLFTTTKKWPRNHPMQLKLEKMLITLLCTSTLAFLLLDNKLFREFIYELNSNFRMFTRKRFRYTLLPIYYQNLRRQLDQDLQSAKFVNLTIDAWTDPRQK